MFKNLKEKIKELAKIAVLEAETALGCENGKQKKTMAISYIINHLSMPLFFKPIFSLLLSSFIDEAVEFAVQYMKEI